MEKNRKMMNRRLLAFLKKAIGFYLWYRYRISAENADALGLSPPYVLLANHTNFWDPFFLSLYVPEPVSYVASDEYFRNPVLKRLLKLAGAIPKSKFTSDAAAVFDILRVKRSGGVIGIFPEGKRSWDGRTGELLFATSKLVKSLKIPVLTATLEGAHLSFPRWAKNSRRGRVFIRYRLSLTPEKIAAMSAEEIHKALGDSLAYRESEFERKNHIPFQGRDLAENLELYLFVCPECHSLCSLETKGDVVSCRSCGFTASYGEEGTLSPVRGDLPFETPGEWGDWQENYFGDLLRGEPENPDFPVFEDRDVTLKRGKRMIPLRKISFGQMRLFPDRIEFTNLRKQVTAFPIDRISGVNVQYSDQFEFYCGELLYRFSFRSRKTSAYKWALAVRLIRALHGDPILTD